MKLGALSPSSLVMGISITQFITTSLEIAVYLLTIYFLGFPGKGNPVFAFIVGLTTIPPIVGVGLISAVAFKDEMLAMSVPGTAGIPLSFLSGAFIPLPKVMLVGKIEIWHINPLYAASEAIRKILFYDYTLSQVFMELAFVLVVGIIIFLLGAYIFYKTVYRRE
jgi:ABC-type multidrug transport system permease subunit